MTVAEAVTANVWTRKKRDGGLTALETGLAPIAEKRVFLQWRLQGEPGQKPRKVPYLLDGALLTGSYSDPALPAKLGTLPEVLALVRQGERYSGVGVAFFPGCGIVGLDLDSCLGEGGKWCGAPDQKDALRAFHGHAFLERSVSGAGLHALACGHTKTLKANGFIELFGDRNFLALTGDVLRGGERIQP